MKKTQSIMYAALAFIMLVAVASCSSHDAPDEPVVKPVSPAQRTLLVYMVANNSLGISDLDMQDLREMQVAARQGVLGDNRLLVYHSPYNGAAPVLKEVLGDGSIDTLKTYDANVLSITKAQMRRVVSDVQEPGSGQ